MDVPVNRLKAALARGEMQTGLWMSFANPIACEIAAKAGYDWCLIDGEHGPSDIPLVLTQLQALATGDASAVVRVPAGETRLIKQVLDLGAQTLLIPMVDSAAQAAELVRAVRYPGAGIRGIGAFQSRASGYGLYGDYLTQADDQICLLVQAESRAALSEIDAIAATEGVDGVFVGPADLSADMGYPGQQDAPEVVAAIENAVARIRAAGKAVGIVTFDPGQVAYYRDLGVTFLGVGGDVACYASSVRALAADVKARLKG